MAYRIPKGQRQSIAHARAPKQEKQRAKALGAVCVPRSGAGDMKGDVRKKGVLRLECKTTIHKSFAVTREMVRKIEEAALASGELPAIEVEFLGHHGKPEMTIAILPGYVLDYLKEAR